MFAAGREGHDRHDVCLQGIAGLNCQPIFPKITTELLAEQVRNSARSGGCTSHIPRHQTQHLPLHLGEETRC